MPSFSATLTWATPVDPVSLGSHFEAYINLRPTIHTFRLCNRFSATRLPIELMAIIEDYLMEDEREKCQCIWACAFACWEGRCDIEDHFTAEKLKEIFATHSERCECGITYDLLATELNGAQTFCLIGALTREAADDKVHMSRKESWEAKAGRSATTDRGLFSRHKQLFLRDFGLRVWVSHSQQNDGIVQAHKVDRHPSTVSYLTTPDSGKVKGNYERRIEDPDAHYDMPYLSTESGYGLSVAPPTRPSEQSLRRFPRAMRMLGLSPLKKGKTELYASSKDINEQAVTGNEHDDGGPDSKAETMQDSSMPELHFLVSCGYDMDGMW